MYLRPDESGSLPVLDHNVLADMFRQFLMAPIPPIEPVEYRVPSKETFNEVHKILGLPPLFKTVDMGEGESDMNSKDMD